MLEQEVFRFVQLSAPAQNPRKLQLKALKTKFSEKLQAVKQESEESIQKSQDVAGDYLRSDTFEVTVKTLPLSKELFTLLEQLRLQTEEPSNLKSFLEDLVKTTFDKDAKTLIQSKKFKQTQAQVADSLIALKILPETHPQSLADYVEIQRSISIIQGLAEEDANFEGITGARLARSPIALPDSIFPISDTPIENRSDEAADKNGTSEDIAKINGEIIELDNTLHELLTLGSEDLETVFTKDETQGSTDPTSSEGISSASTDDILAPNTSIAATEESTTASINRDVSGKILTTVSSRTVARLKTSSLERLSPITKKNIDTLNIDASHSSIRGIVDRVTRQIQLKRRALETKKVLARKANFTTVGTTTIPMDLPPMVEELLHPDDRKVPDTVGKIRPSHVGHLLKVQQHILRYEAEEIAHVENVVIGESKNRETRRLRRTEETVIKEQESISEEERDLQTTERMEMQREVQNMLKHNQNLNVSASITASYGPVEATVTTDFSTATESESATLSAASFAREVTEKSASRVSERIRNEQTTRTLQEFEETNQHGFHNQTNEHVAAMFQWLVKVYRNQLYDYGTRLFFNISVPEPQTFVLSNLIQQKMPALGSGPPKAIDFKPSDINTSNYLDYIKEYQVTGVNPPPEEIKVLSKTFRYPDSDAPQEGAPPTYMTDSAELPIEEGYKAIEAFVYFIPGRAIHGETKAPSGSTENSVGHDGRNGVALSIGQGSLELIVPNGSIHKAGAFGPSSLPLGDETGSIPVAVFVENLLAYLLVVEVILTRTDRAMEKWQIETYDSIVTRYEALEAEYQERKAEQAIQDGVKISGRNPLENRRIERTELKRCALSMITGQYFNNFDAIIGNTNGGRIDFDQAHAEGHYIRFMENAFEWENMAYTFYPYFYGRRSKWVQKHLLEDVDALHAEFLKCGYADIQLPVRPGYEAALFHYLDTGRVWRGSEPPNIANPKYADFLDEIESRREREAPEQTIPRSEPWDIRIPTTLVRIRPGNSLPEWHQDEETGEWIPVSNNVQ